MTILKMLIQKYVIFIVHCISLFIGIGLFFIGTELILTHKNYEIFLKTQNIFLTVIIFGTGIILTVTSLLGCLGIVEKGVLVINVIVSSLALVFFLKYVLDDRKLLLDDTKLRMTDVLGNYSNFNENKVAWNSIQQEFHCCGVVNLSDWTSMNVEGCVVQEEGVNFTVPFSCSNCKTMSCSKIYQKGCLFALENFFSVIYTGATLVFIGVLVSQLSELYWIYSKVQEQEEYQYLLRPRPLERL